jgi:hypothetical protein
MTEIVDEFRKLEQRLEGKSLGRHRRITGGWRIPISPLTPNGDAAASGVTQNQRLGPSDTPGFENGITLPPKGMEWVAHFSPSQRLVENLGSSL